MYVGFDNEMLVLRVNFRMLGVSVNGLKAQAEFADVGQVLLFGAALD
jgi:hypothetical protein